MNTPLVSICIPAYNNADYIEETIQSVLASTYQNLELLIVDDQSVDNTYAFLQELVDKLTDPRVQIFQNEKNLGMAGNWNQCLSLCQGDYIKLLCADDLIDPTLIAKEVAILEKYPSVGMVSSDTAFVDLQGERKKFSYKRYHSKGIIDGRKACRFSAFTRDYLGAPLANTFRRTVYEEVGGFDQSFHYIIDYDFFMRIYLAHPVYILHEPNRFA